MKTMFVTMPMFVLGCAITSILGPGCRSTSSKPIENRPTATSKAHADPVFQHGAVAADHPLASQAGLEMLKKGGNAVDAAVATSFCLSVVRPYSCGIGGGGFMLIYLSAKDGVESKCIAINYRETCPAAIDRDFYAKFNDKYISQVGAYSVAVPGTVAGLVHALERYGSLDLATVLQPAIRAAEAGFAVDVSYVAACTEVKSPIDKVLASTPSRPNAGVTWFEHLRGRFGPPNIGDIIKNPQQARALKLIAKEGRSAFYSGEIAHAMIKATIGGMTLQDLKNYTVQETEPLRGRFRGNTVFSMPPPSSGGIAMQQIFGLLDLHESDLSGVKPNSADYIHLVTESFKHAFADRSEWLADPAFVDVPVARLTDPRYLDELSKRIDMQHTLDNPFDYGSIVSSENPNPLNDHGTSHLCAIDSTGMAVACTETINLEFGSLVEVPGFGFFLNDEMDDFTTLAGEPNAFGLRQSEKNLPQPGKRPLSSMSPTIMVKDGRVVLIAGASGGPRIITGTTQAILNCLLFDMPPDAAAGAPRFHHQWMPNTLRFENACANQAVRDDLHGRGHEIGVIDVVGQVQLIRIGPDGIRAASDPRKGGMPAGY